MTLSPSETAGTLWSLGIVDHNPTQFDEPFYRFLTRETGIRCTAYYYKSSASGRIDHETGLAGGWNQTSERGYSAVFLPEATPLAFARKVVAAKHDLIITSYHSRHSLYTALLARLHGIPVGLRTDGLLAAAGGRQSHLQIKSLVFPLLFRLFTTGHPVGKQTGDYLIHYGFSKESLFLFPYAVDHHWFSAESAKLRADLSALRASWGLPEGAKVVCGVVKFSEREDPLTLVRAVRIARQQLPDIALLLIGDGPLRRQVEEAAGEELGKSIVLPGYQEYRNLPRVYAAGDLFVHTARGPWEVSVNEALACGLPVVASDRVGSARELVLPHGFGYSYKHGDAGELAKMLVAVLTDPQLLKRVREEGAASLEPWCYDATAGRLADAIQFAKKTA